MYKNIDEYIKTFPPEVQKKMVMLRQAIREAAPRSVEGICYRMPSFKMKKHLVFFAGFNNHIGFYPLPSAIEKFKKELSGYKTAKGSVQFPLDAPLPIELIKKIVEFRVEEDSG